MEVKAQRDFLNLPNAVSLQVDELGCWQNLFESIAQNTERSFQRLCSGHQLSQGRQISDNSFKI